MTLSDGWTLAEYDHQDAIGHEIAVSAERFVDRRPSQVWLMVTNCVLREDGTYEPDWFLSPAQARDLAASLLLAADHADGRP